LRQKATVLYDWFDVEPSGLAAESTSATNAFARFGIAEGARVLLMPSRVEPWKGQHVLIEALPAIFARCPDCVALFVGSSVTGRGREAYSTQLVTRAQELGIEPRVLFAGHVEDVAALMRASAVVLHCSVTPEPFGMTILEAMALGTPVVAAGAGGPLEIAGDTESLLLHRPGDSVDLASQTLRVLVDDEFADKLRDLGRARARSFSERARWPALEALLRNPAASVEPLLTIPDHAAAPCLGGPLRCD
jgi:glycosyltransferase involved in cell wall biosynthesis